VQLIRLFARCLWRLIFPNSWHFARPRASCHLQLNVLEGRIVPSGNWAPLPSEPHNGAVATGVGTMFELSNGVVLAQARKGVRKGVRNLFRR
jgi:hypothetical protein